MPLSSAHTRLKNGYYNTSDWNASTNPGGMGGDGHRLALIPPKAPQTPTNNVLTTDFATVAEEVVTSAATSATQADGSAVAAAAALASTQVVATAILGGDNVQAVSTSTLTAVTGLSQAFQLPAGKTYMPGMPVRFAAQAPSTLIIDGRIETYNRTTGAGTFMGLRAEGSGTASAWNVMLIGQPVTQIGGYQSYLTEVASLAQWQNVFIATPGIADAAAAKRRVVTMLEAGVSAQAFTNQESFNAADRSKFTLPQTAGTAQITVPAAWQAQTSVTLSAGFWSGKNAMQILDMSSTMAVVIWIDSSSNFVAQAISYANPASPSIGSVTNLGTSGINEYRAVRINTVQFGLLVRNNSNQYGAGSYYLSGTSIASYGNSYYPWQSGYSSGDVYAVGNFGQATFAISPTGGNNARAYIPAERTDSGGTMYGYLEVIFHTSGVTFPSSGNVTGFGTNGSSHNSTSGVGFCALHTGAVLAVQGAINSANQNREIAFAFLGVENTGSRQVLTYAAGSGNPGANFLGFGASATGSGAEAWLYFSIPTPGNPGAARADYVTISRSGSTLTASAAVFDATSPTSPSWHSLLNGAIFDGYPNHRYAYRRGGTVGLEFSHPFINSLEGISFPFAVSNNRANGLATTASTLEILSFPGVQAVLASGTWQSGDVGQTLYLPNGTGRVASISGATATLDRTSGSMLGTVVTAANWSLSPLLFASGLVTGNAGGGQAIATGAGQLNARRWKQIDGVTASILGTVYMLASFDGRRTWRMASGGSSRIVASNRAADHGGTDNAWYSRTTGTTWTGPKADMLTAIRDAVMAGSANQAAPASFSSTAIFNQAGWVAGWNATFDLALVLANASASVDNLTLSYSAYEMFRPVDGASVQVRTDDPEGVTVTRTAAGSSSTLRIHVQY